MPAGDVLVQNTIGPRGAGDYPTARATDLLGGYRSVADVAARNAIPTSHLVVGMLVRTNDTGTVWQLDNTVGPVWSEFVLVATGARFLQSGTTQVIYVRPTTGDDTTGDGLTALTAYATVQRALTDIPDGFNCYVKVDVEAGTFATQQNWAVAATPGFMDPAGTSTGRVYIVGDHTSPDLTLASTGAGTLVSGKRAQMRFAVGAYGASITDGSHWIRQQDAVASGIDSTKVCLASTSPDLDVVTPSSTAMTTVTVNPYTTTFSGTVRISAPKGPALNSIPFVFIQGIKFTGSVQASNVTFDGVQATALPVTSDCQVQALACIGAGYSAGFSDYARKSIVGLLIKDGALTLLGMAGSVLGCVIKGAGGAAGKINAGFSGSTIASVRAPSGANLFQDVDLEGTGDGVWLSGMSTLGNGSSGTSVTFALTSGRALLLDHGSRLTFGNGTHAWTGTSTVASVVKNGAVLEGGSTGFGVTNTTTPGDDLAVGGGPFRALDDFYTDLGDLSRYAAVV